MRYRLKKDKSFIVNAIQFSSKGNAVERRKFISKHKDVIATDDDGTMTLNTNTNKVHINDDDWLLDHEGYIYVVRKKTFKALYEVLS